MNWLQAGVGLFGAVDAFNKNKGAREYNRAAAAELAARAGTMNRIRELADNYDPSIDSVAAVVYGREQARVASEQALANTNARFRQFGGQPGGDTNFRYATDSDVRRVNDPLKLFAAEQKSTETARKVGMYQQALSGSGDVTGQYMALSQQERANPAPSLDILAAGIDAMDMAGQAGRSVSGSVQNAGSKFAGMTNAWKSKAQKAVDRFTQGPNRRSDVRTGQELWGY